MRLFYLRFAFLWGFLGLALPRAQAQLDMTPLPESPDALYDAIETILSYQNQSQCLEILDRFKKNIKSRYVTDQHYQGIIKLGNEMVARKMKRYNFFKYLIETVNVFSQDNGLTTDYFDKWIEISIKILADQAEGKTQAFEDYLEFSLEFWANGNLYKRGGGSHTWRADSKDFTMIYENKDLRIAYPNTNLYCFLKSDSLVITRAKGIYFPLRDLWEGEMGRVEWNQAGATDAYCDIQRYTISTKQVDYRCDNAILTYPSVFRGRTIDGKLSDRIARRSEGFISSGTGENAKMISKLTHPRFESKRRDIKMDDIGEGVSYFGGFFIKGAEARGFGDESGKSVVTVQNRENKMIIKAISKDFDITKGERVQSGEAEVTVYLYTEKGVDSIYHPSIKFIYDIKNRQMTLERGESQSSRVPFFNSLQQVEMNATTIKWQIDSDNMDIGDNATDVKFDSDSYFDIILWERYQNLAEYNPLALFAIYSETLERYYKEAQDDYEMAKMRFQIDKENNPADSAMMVFYYPGRVVEGTDPRTIKIDTLARLLDPRLNGIILATPGEVAQIEADMKDKLGPNYKNTGNYKNFQKQIMDVSLLSGRTNQPPPSHDFTNTLPMFLELVRDGFLLYDSKDSTVTLRDKTFHYLYSVNKTDIKPKDRGFTTAPIKSAKPDDHDFDQIRINSVPSKKDPTKPNATLNIKEGVVESNGVQFFTLSDSQQVVAQPYEGKVKIKEGRDMDFDGILRAGHVAFTGKGFHFDYTNFDVYMDTIEYIDFYIFERERDEEGWGTRRRAVDPMTGLEIKALEPINSVMEGAKGLLIIDATNNKSGRKNSVPYLPSFESLGKSRVYYDKRNRQGDGIYPRENFYYELEPFIRDSLDKFEPEVLKFKGKFYSADIMPIWSEPLRVMFHDVSFGFESETPPDGFNIYLREEPETGKGHFKGVFGVSNEGLIGLGRLDYLGATIESEYIEFLPEQFRADDVDSFNLARSVRDGVEYPKVHGEKVKIDWAPYSDSMYVESAIVDGIPFQFFDSGEFTLDGSLTLTPEGLLGRGIFQWDAAEMESNPGGDFVFGSNSLRSPSTRVVIKSTGLQEFAFENDNVEAIVDFDKQTGDFISNEEDLSTTLPYNSYKTSLDQFHWDMKTQHIFMEATNGKTGFFLATEHAQDSLFFLGEKADYDLNTGLLMIDGVEFIRVADAFVYPKDEHVEIEERAHMRTLMDSRIVADTANKNHVIQRATINVLSRSEYKADGFLEFDVAHKKQEIKFSDVRAEQEGPGKFVTKGSGAVYEDDTFYLDRRTRFKGEVKLSADSKDLFFKGYARINSEVLPTKEWFTIESQIDKKNVAIAYEAPRNPMDEQLYVGMYVNVDSLHAYPAILEPKKNPLDRSFFSTTGYIRYDEKESSFLFGDSARVMAGSDVGKKITVSEKTSKVTAEGRFDFNQGFNAANLPNVNVDAIGDFSFFLGKKSDYRFDMAMNLNFYLPQVLIDLVFADLTANPDASEKILYNSVSNIKLKRYMAEFLNDEKKLEKVWKKVQEEDKLLLGTDLTHMFFFSGMTLMWSDKTGSFMSRGPLQLASFGGKHLGYVLQGGFEIMMDAARGDVWNLYFMTPDGDYYFFSYQNGILMTTSSNPDYTNNVAALKAKDKKIRTENGQTFEVMIGNSAQYNQFKNRHASAF